MLTCSGGSIYFTIGNEEIFNDGIAAWDIHINLMKSLYDFLTATEGTFISAVCLTGFDSIDNKATMILGPISNEINHKYNLVHIFYPLGTNKDGQQWKYKTYDIKPYDMAIELIKDIETDFEQWIYFYNDTRNFFSKEDHNSETYENDLEERFKINIKDWLKQHHTKEELKIINKDVKKRTKETKYWLKKLKKAVKNFKSYYHTIEK